MGTPILIMVFQIVVFLVSSFLVSCPQDCVVGFLHAGVLKANTKIDGMTKSLFSSFPRLDTNRRMVGTANGWQQTITAYLNHIYEIHII